MRRADQHDFNIDRKLSKIILLINYELWLSWMTAVHRNSKLLWKCNHLKSPQAFFSARCYLKTKKNFFKAASLDNMTRKTKTRKTQSRFKENKAVNYSNTYRFVLTQAVSKKADGTQWVLLPARRDTVVTLNWIIWCLVLMEHGGPWWNNSAEATLILINQRINESTW